MEPVIGSQAALREDDGILIPKWERVWAFFAGNNLMVADPRQKRQLGALKRLKLD